jgi:hypothetical protein
MACVEVMMCGRQERGPSKASEAMIDEAMIFTHSQLLVVESLRLGTQREQYVQSGEILSLSVLSTESQSDRYAGNKQTDAVCGLKVPLGGAEERVERVETGELATTPSLQHCYAGRGKSFVAKPDNVLQGQGVWCLRTQGGTDLSAACVVWKSGSTPRDLTKPVPATARKLLPSNSVALRQVRSCEAESCLQRLIASACQPIVAQPSSWFGTQQLDVETQWNAVAAAISLPLGSLIPLTKPIRR